MDRLDAYFVAYTIALLVLTALYMSFSPRSRRALSLVGLAAFAGFGAVVALRVVDILSGR